MRQLPRFATTLLRCIPAFFRCRNEQALVELALREQLATYSQRGVGIEGTVVVHAGGGPVGGIIVGLFDEGNEFVARASDFTDADRRFEFSELDDGEYVVRTTRVVSYWPDYAGQTFPLASERVSVRAGTAAAVRIEEPESASISGNVTARDGTPVRDGIEICVVRVDLDLPLLGRRDECDIRVYTIHGRYVAPRLARGFYRVAAEAESATFVRRGGIDVDLSA